MKEKFLAVIEKFIDLYKSAPKPVQYFFAFVFVVAVASAVAKWL